MLKVLFNVILFLLVFVIQVSFINVLISPLNNINLALISSVFLIVLINKENGLVWAFFFALFLEFYSAYYPGIFFILFCCVNLIVYFLSKNIFTNKSLTSTSILLLIAMFSFRLFILLLQNTLALLQISKYYRFNITFFINSIFSEMFFSLIIIYILFVILDLLTNRMKTNLINR